MSPFRGGPDPTLQKLAAAAARDIPSKRRARVEERTERPGEVLARHDWRIRRSLAQRGAAPFHDERRPPLRLKSA